MFLPSETLSRSPSTTSPSEGLDLAGRVGDSVALKMPSSAQGQLRLGYLDWLRGLACLVMFQTHCYDSWLGGTARQSTFFGWSRFGGTLPAPLFLFLAGISFALVTDRLRRKGVAPRKIAMKTINRGAFIFLLGLLFRLQEYILGLPGAHWTDLLRVDVLNVIGVSIMMMGLLCWVVRTRVANAIASGGVALAISMLAPPLWTSWRPRWLPWFFESYVNGVHTYDAPQPWLFPIFPWAAFAFAGLAVGFLLFSDWARQRLTATVSLLGAGGIGLYFLALWIDARPVKLYSVYDFWHTSPNFFLARVGILLVITFLGYAWCTWGPGDKWFSPLRQLGQTSLLVYWVHIEFVYGSLSILTKHAQTVASATVGLFVIFAAMVLLSIARTWWKAQESGSPALRPATES